MSLKAIDAQVTMNKVNEISRLQKLEQQQGQLRQDNAAAKVKDDSNKAEQSVKELNHTEKKTINNANDGNRKDSRKKNKDNTNDDKGKKTEEGLEISEKHLGKYFDFRI